MLADSQASLSRSVRSAIHDKCSSHCAIWLNLSSQDGMHSAHLLDSAAAGANQVHMREVHSPCAALANNLHDLLHKLNETLWLLDPDAYAAHQAL